LINHEQEPKFLKVKPEETVLVGNEVEGIVSTRESL
tara:strand:+ start:625 stop:732 length:108 start_codon:yes stop_codon:yes gene_type:complete